MKHLADHRSSSTGARLQNFLRLARAPGEKVWNRLHQRGRPLAAGNRRLVEFARIERGRQA